MVFGGNHVLLVAVIAALMMLLVSDASAEDVACIVDDQGQLLVGVSLCSLWKIRNIFISCSFFQHYTLVHLTRNFPVFFIFFFGWS